jgi:hypothetical protein
MPLWGKSTSAASRPKFLPDDSNSNWAREFAFATTAGWALKPGGKSSGNDNTSAEAEVIATVRGLSATLAAPNVLSADFTAGEYARTETFDIVLTFDEAITVSSAAWSADQVISNKWYFTVLNYGPTDMVNDGLMQMQYFSGSGTNTITFRGTIPGTAVANGRIGDPDYALTLDGSATAVDGNGTSIGNIDLAGSGAAGGADRSSEIFANAVTKTGDTVMTEETVSGSSSGSAQCLVGVTTAVS